MVDHLLAWRAVRDQVPWTDVSQGGDWLTGPVLARRDGIAHRIATVEHDRDPVRAQRLHVAYRQMRADAATGEALNLELLSKWQCAVLGVAAAPFRSGPAFAKGGRERYGLGPHTAALFESCLRDSGEVQVPVAARAARVYLDVCFFHPFVDGNARAALLALAFVLAANGIVLDQIGPIAQIQRPADDPEGALGLARLVKALIEGTQRRLGQTAHAAARPLRDVDDRSTVSVS
jgi:hypothetical protein